MSVKLKIKVTKEILEKSKMCGYMPDGSQLYGDEWATDAQQNCAVALAVRDIFPKAKVFQSCMDVGEDVIRFPVFVYTYIQSFDKLSPEERAEMPELEFEIDIPEEVIEQIDIEALRPLLHNHPTLQLV